MSDSSKTGRIKKKNTAAHLCQVTESLPENYCRINNAKKVKKKKIMKSNLILDR